jgi:glycosyltransferase involved in cell wall biosynthesis
VGGRAKVSLRSWWPKLRRCRSPSDSTPSRGTVAAIGPLPPPVNGLSKAFGMVTAGLERYGWRMVVIDSADRTGDRVGSAFSLARFKAVLEMLMRATGAVLRADIIYITIAQSRLGFAKDMLIIRWATLWGRPVVVHMHGGNFGGFYAALTAGERRLVRSTLDRLSAIIVLTEKLKADFAMADGWRERTHAIVNTCDAEPGAVRRLSDRKLRVLFLSGLLVSKGYRETISAVAGFAQQRPEWAVTLDVAGRFFPERDFSDTEQQARDLAELLAILPPNVTAKYHGEVGGAAKASLLAACDVLVLPTCYVNEGQPIAIIEALTAGAVVVASDWRGIRETLPAAMHPLLVAPRDVGAIVDRLNLLVDNREMLETLSRAGLAQAERFRPEAHLAAVNAVLEQATRRDRVA